MARTKGKGKAVDAGTSRVKKTKRVVQGSSSGPPTKKRKVGEPSGVKNVEDGCKSPKGKKLKRKEFAIPNDVKCRRRIKNTEDGPDAKKKTDHPKLKTRTTTSTFFKKLTVLNDAQKDAVRSIGFGHILEFKVNRVPSKLAYWVLDRFNHRSCTLELDVLTKIEIEEDDVYRVYGFPKGNKLIENFQRTAENELFIEWKNFFNVANRDKIKIKAVLRRMVDSADGGSWFKRHFVIALCFSLMESCTSGTVHPYIFSALANIEEIKSWNWGEYLLRCLIDHKKSWMTDKTKVFGGPILSAFLRGYDTNR
ncbi:uncharacterized protein LOC131025129 [Salvia miltiorrhiza]|uniref:uncharacterized protein LOC131025129 n=1 Tax=Salvia miltiorrhiza TaxID=226208 RepID=UPI0025AD38A7|nr:uncharacterized protein LOC131025129 [Salvia miltiorrhiza]